MDLSLETLLPGIAGLVALHAILVAFSRRSPALSVLATIFILVSPFSLAPLVPMAFGYKLLRIYTTVLMFVVALFAVRRVSLRTPTKMVLVFVVYHFLAVIWSDHILEAAKYKGLFALLAISGVIFG